MAMILTETERARMSELRDGGRALTPAETAELEAIYKKIEDAEAVYLAPANERMRQQIIRSEERNAHLRILLEKKRALADKLERMAAEAEAERSSLEAEEAWIQSAYPKA